MEYLDIYKEGKETIERVFAKAKENHGMRYTKMCGLQKVKIQVTLTFTYMNLKKRAMWKRKSPASNLFNSGFLCYTNYFPILPAAKLAYIKGE